MLSSSPWQLHSSHLQGLSNGEGLLTTTHPPAGQITPPAQLRATSTSPQEQQTSPRPQHLLQGLAAQSSLLHPHLHKLLIFPPVGAQKRFLECLLKGRLLKGLRGSYSQLQDMILVGF